VLLDNSTTSTQLVTNGDERAQLVEWEEYEDRFILDTLECGTPDLTVAAVVTAVHNQLAPRRSREQVLERVHLINSLASTTL
jgi:hypothetical protein